MFPNNNSASGWVGTVGSVREVQGLEIMNREGNTFRSKVSLNANIPIFNQNKYGIGNI